MMYVRQTPTGTELTIFVFSDYGIVPDPEDYAELVRLRGKRLKRKEGEQLAKALKYARLHYRPGMPLIGAK